MIAHLGILRNRVGALRSSLDTSVIWKVLVDLEKIHRLMPEVEGTHLAARARWLRDCLDDELHRRLEEAERLR